MTVFDETVADIMQRDVVTVAPDLPVAELLNLLEEEGISGVPVVGPDGTVEGVISLADIARAAEHEAATGEPPSRRVREREGERSTGFFRLPSHTLGALPDRLPKTKLGGRAVRDLMTPASFSVRPDASVGEAARFLDRAGIHRALVFDGPSLAGIVTAMDLVRVLARADRERVPRRA